MFTAELCDKLRITLTSYIDCLSATSATNAQLSEHSRGAVETIDTAMDCESHSKTFVVNPLS